jgi:hypothetical protein
VAALFGILLLLLLIGFRGFLPDVIFKSGVQGLIVRHGITRRLRRRLTFHWLRMRMMRYRVRSIFVMNDFRTAYKREPFFFLSSFLALSLTFVGRLIFHAI